ncbi:MAG: hypothetical protein WDZ80_07890 [Candidatus Paceibacterota bacterium]
MEKIKLPRSSYEELSKIIIAYSTLDRACSLDDIAHTSGIGKTNVSANNAFLANVEIIEGGNKKQITQKGLKLGRALEHEIEQEVPKAWQEVINESDFLTKMVQAVKIRKGMDSSQLENHIAFSSGEKKSKSVMTGSRAVVDILLASEMLITDGDKLVANNSTNEPIEFPESKPEVNDELESSRHFISSMKTSGVNINIELRINATPDDLEGLGGKIKTIIEELNEYKE